MKQKVLFVVVLLTTVLSFASCSSDDDREDVKEPQELKYSEVGVWKSGKYFLSLSSDHFLTAYVAPQFLDCGTYIRDAKDVITSNNTYYAKSTTYKIESIDSKTMQIKVEYKDIRGEGCETSLTLTKTNTIPATKDNPLVGKNFSWLAYFGTTTVSYNTYNTGVMTNTWKNYRDYPLTVYYIYLDNTIYYQLFTQAGQQVPTMGGWASDANDGEIFASKVIFNNDGSIKDMEGVN